MKVNNVELDEDDNTNLVDGVKWRSTESDNSIFSRKNIGFTIGLFVLTALVITGLVLLKNAYVPCSLTRDANVENVFEHLKALNDIGKTHKNRAANTSGYEASVLYVLKSLARTEYTITVQKFTYSSSELIGTPQLNLTGPNGAPFVFQTDFVLMDGTGGGKAEAAIGNNPKDFYGCNASDFAGFVEGQVAVISRGFCPFATKIQNAALAKAGAAVIFNNEAGLILVRGADVPFPTFFTTRTIGELLVASYEANKTILSFDAMVTKMLKTTSNVLAETNLGNPNYTIVVGSHLDSVPAGKGINDNGSGSSINLELAVRTSTCFANLRNKIIFAWWGAEELGLLGSTHFVKTLTKEQKANIALNLNFDMLGSPNYVLSIYNGTGANETIRPQSERIQMEFEKYFKANGVPFTLSAFDGRSDYGPFIENEIPAGGLATGAEGIKTEEERDLFGGLANAAYDPCYHQFCDDVRNINRVAMAHNLKAAASVLQTLGLDENLVKSISNKNAIRTSRAPFVAKNNVIRRALA